MPKYYPINLDLKDKKCIVIGGGEVAQRKVETLLEVGATVWVISPQVTDKLQHLAEQAVISCYLRDYRAGDLHGAFMAVGATDNQQVNRQIARDAAAANILVNIVDQPQLCNYIVPASVIRGELVISISTGGNSPALSRHIRQQLERQFGPEYETLVDLLGKVREQVLAQVADESKRRDIFHQLADIHPDLVKFIKIRDWDNLKARLRQVLGFEVGL